VRKDLIDIFCQEPAAGHPVAGETGARRSRPGRCAVGAARYRSSPVHVALVFDEYGHFEAS